MKKTLPYVLLSASMYLAGIIGLNLASTEEIFRSLTPFHLLSSLGILLFFEPKWNKSVVLFIVITYCIGFFIEVLGVNTGLIFGEYAYGKTLGIKIWDTPLMIGVNWLLLALSMAKVISQYFPHLGFWSFSFFGAAFMTLVDYLAEPIAIKHDMWSWTLEEPPVHNYLGWFVVSFVIMAIYRNLRLEKENRIAKYILLLQVAFFASQYFL